MGRVYTVFLESGQKKITEEQLSAYASYFSLDAAVRSRVSELFWLDLCVYTEEFGFDPRAVLHEITCLESNAGAAETKPATEFKHPPLKGLWHKHFFSAHFIPENIVNGLSRGALKKLVDEIFDPSKSSVVIEAMTLELAHRAVHEPLQNRADQGTLTGEWIVFAKHNGQNYYLCLNTHDAGDQVIWDRIKANCVRDFPFLDIFEPAPGDRIDELVARYQPLLDAMQTPEAKAAAKAAFRASPEELGQAAVTAAAKAPPSRIDE